MKKIFALAIVVVALASCKKDYTCTCSGIAEVTVELDGLSASEAKDAKSDCESGTGTVDGVSQTCTWSEK